MNTGDKPVIGWGEVCRNHGIANPEDLDSALADYKMQADELRSYRIHFNMAQHPHRSADGVLWLCPKCSHRVHIRHTYCHWCGKKMNDIQDMGARGRKR